MKSPLVVAMIGCAISIVLYSLSGAIKHKLLRGLAQLASVLGPMALMGLIVRDVETSMAAGQYYFIGIVAFVIASKLFGDKKDS